MGGGGGVLIRKRSAKNKSRSGLNEKLNGVVEAELDTGEAR